jgi:mono/diheme cytochrome c family protein
MARGGFLALCVLAIGLGACAGLSLGDFARGYAEGRASALDAHLGEILPQEQSGALAFAVSDFGALNTDTLETHATPWRLAAAALALSEVQAHGGGLTRARVREAMTRYGFVYPERIGNWPEGLPEPARDLDAPMGLSVGVIRRDTPKIRLTGANLACAACHAGTSFDADGAPVLDTAWLGTPNTSLDLEAYVQGLYSAFKAARMDEERLIGAVRTLFPDTSEDEVRTIRRFVMPRLNARLDVLEREGDRPLPFVNGAPGLTNGVAALRMQFGTLGPNAYEAMRGFTSIPDLGARGFRSMLLYDGAYAPREGAPQREIRASDIDREHLNGLAEVTAFFTVPSMGVHPNRAAARIGEAEDVLAFLSSYEAPRFPGEVGDSAAAGRDIYSARCAACHGRYDESLTQPRLVSFPNWIGPYDTDPVRAAAFDAATVEAVRASPYGGRIQTRATGQYAAPLLTGLWLSAPYLHNGSVPTLWHLMHPEERPARFLVGGHRLDYARMGLDVRLDVNGDYVYPENYRPWSQPALIDTSTPGFSNRGHDSEFSGMSEEDKAALLQYLKLL